MNNFQIHRFGLVLRRDLTENRKYYLQYLAGVFVSCLSIILSALYSPCRYGYSPMYEEQVLHKVSGGIFFVYVLVMGVGIAETFRCLCTKQQRTSYLMLPASLLEKFVSRLFIFTVLLTVGFAVAAVLADLARMLLYAPFTYHMGFSLATVPADLASAFGNLLNPSISQYSWKGITVTLLICGMSLWQHSLFLLGSSIFRKRPFLLTLLAEIVGGCLLAYVLSFVSLPDFKPLCDILASEKAEFIVADCVAALFFLLTAFNYRMTYRNLRRCPVIGGKWFHI